MNKKSTLIALSLPIMTGCFFDGTGLGSTGGQDTINSSGFDTTIGDPPIDTSSSSTSSTSKGNTSSGGSTTSSSSTTEISSSSSGDTSGVIDTSSSTSNPTSETSSISFCGDWIINEGEECDDGPEGSMGCDAACQNIICGDQIISGNEECDDGNKIDDDDCSNSCQLKRKVFLSAIIPSSNLKGIKGADSICQNEADSFGINGIFKAWLSESVDTSPFFRFQSTNFEGWYVLAIDDSIKIAKGWKGLSSDSGILNSINYQLNGNKVMVTTAITNTDKNGLIFDNVNTCSNFKSNDMNDYSYHSNVDNAVLWSDNIKYACDKPGRLYCFETK